MTKTELLKKLWTLHCYQILQPLSWSYEIFLLSLAAFHSKNFNFVEYGPFTGQTSAFICSISKYLGGKTLLVDSYPDTTYLSGDSIREIGKVNAGILFPDSFEFRIQDITDNYNLDIEPGFVYFDICVGQKTAEVLCSIIEKIDRQTEPSIIIIDDCVDINGPGSNRAFLEYLTPWFENNKLTNLRPFLVTQNKLFLSNFRLPSSWSKSLVYLQENKFIKMGKCASRFSNLPIYEHNFNGPSIGNHYILSNENFWAELGAIID